MGKLINGKVLLGLILLLGLFVRVYRLQSVPPGFFADEASRGVEAYSLLTRGVDTHGDAWSLFFRALDAPIPGLQFYSVMPFVALLGLNEVAVRLASVFWGMMGIIAVYFLGNEIDRISNAKYQISKIGLWAVLVMAMEPWAVHYSRIGWEAMVYMALYTWGWWTWLKAKSNQRWWVGFGLVWGLVLCTYTGAGISVPLTVGLLTVFSFNNTRKRFHWKWFLVGLGIFGVMALPLLNHLFLGDGLTRWEQVAGGELSGGKTRLELFADQYMHQLSLGYFFGEGEDTFITRHFTRGLLPLLWVQAPLIILGLIFLWRKFNQLWWLGLWLLLYPVVGAMANGGPFSGRSIVGAPVMAMISAVGIVYLFEISQKLKLKIKSLIVVLVLIGLGWSFVGFWGFYMNEYPLRAADFWGWQYGPKEIVAYFKNVEQDYDDLYLSHEFNSAGIFLKFYDFEQRCGGCKIGSYQQYVEGRRQIFAMSPTLLNEARGKGFEPEMKESVLYPSGDVAFFVVELSRNQVY